ncbi:ATP-binding protein [Oceanobacter mangrovi]|uniref:ATP-binding protein n=1 Tax=Oceanobacter mangrovi TaxID=2862510 RepID=UPI001C8ECDD8
MTKATHSIRHILLRLLLLVLLATLFFNAITGSWIVRHEVDEVFDAHLVTTTRVLKHLLNRHYELSSRAEMQSNLAHLMADLDDVPERVQPYEKKILVQLWTLDGTELLVKTDNSPAYAISPLQSGLHHIGRNGNEWSVFATRLDELQAWLLVGEIPQAREEVDSNLAQVWILSSIFCLIFAALALVNAVDFGLRPLLSLKQALTRRSIRNLDAIDTANYPAELLAPVTTLNQLFERLTDGISRERRFVADAAHELRTPLSVLKLQAQQLQKQIHQQSVLLGADRLTVANDLVMDLQAGIDRSQRLVEHMLMLARLEGSLDAGILSRVDLAELTRRVIAGRYQQLEHQGAVLDSRLDDKVNSLVEVNLPLAEVALNNLITNAVRYGGGQLDISLLAGIGEVAVSVRDHGPGVPAAMLGQLAAPFFRLGQADARGSGLGLAITARIMRVHGGRLEFVLPAAGGLEVRLWFTLAEADGSDPARGNDLVSVV